MLEEHSATAVGEGNRLSPLPRTGEGQGEGPFCPLLVLSLDLDHRAGVVVGMGNDAVVVAWDDDHVVALGQLANLDGRFCPRKHRVGIAPAQQLRMKELRTRNAHPTDWPLVNRDKPRKNK